MFWEIWNICYISIAVVTCIYGYIRYKNGPTEKQVAKMEKKYNRTFTETDLISYKKSFKSAIIGCTGIVITVTISLFI